MVLLASTFEGPAGAVVSKTNQTSGDQFTVTSFAGTGTAVYQTANAFQGATSMRATADTASSCIIGYDTAFSSTSLAFRFYLYLNADTTANGATYFQARNATGITGAVALNTGRSLQAVLNGGATLAGSALVLSLSQWYGVEGMLVPGASTTTGRYVYRVFNATTNAALVSVDVSNVNLNTGAVVSARLGKTGLPGNVDALFDGFTAGDSTTLLGPLVTSVPATVTAVPATGSAAAPAPAVTGEVAVTGGGAATATGAAPAPAVSAGAAATAIRAPGSATAPAPTVGGGSTAGAIPATGTSTANAPAATAGALITAPPAAGSSTAPAPSVAAVQAAAVASVTATGSALAPAPEVTGESTANYRDLTVTVSGPTASPVTAAGPAGRGLLTAGPTVRSLRITGPVGQARSVRGPVGTPVHVTGPRSDP